MVKYYISIGSTTIFLKIEICIDFLKSKHTNYRTIKYSLKITYKINFKNTKQYKFRLLN